VRNQISGGRGLICTKMYKYTKIDRWKVRKRYEKM